MYRGLLITTYLWEHDVPEDRTYGDKYEEHKVEEEHAESSDLQRQAIIVVREIVEEGRAHARAHDHGIPGPGEMSSAS